MSALTRVYIPRDTTACAQGADRIADLLQARQKAENLPFEIVRNGSRGLYWLEPMLEVETADKRVAFGPVDEAVLEELVVKKFWVEAENHPLYLGPTEEIPFIERQHRVTFQRVGITDPLSIDDYKKHGGFLGLEKAIQASAEQIIAMAKDSGLRGRGGAAFPTGTKWQTVLDTDADRKYIVCNADEGDSGTYSDRMIMESDPYCLIEGMTIAALAVGADTGFIYLREEYPLAHKILTQAINNAREAGYLGEPLLGSNHSFELEVRLGAGAYICGEETSLLESLEGKRGEVRPKPPLPAIYGLFGKPTVVNNVITLASVPAILANGAASYQEHGSDRSRGTLPFQLAGNVKQAGLVEIPFGTTLRSLVEEFGAGTRSGRPMRAIQVGGPLGAYLPECQWDTPLDYEAFAAIDAMLGHGGIVVFDDSVDMSEQALFAMEFCSIESCGKCTPCRIGSVRGVEVIEKIRRAENSEGNKALLEDLCNTMIHGSLCAMGGLTPYPVKSALVHFPEDFASSPGA